MEELERGDPPLPSYSKEVYTVRLCSVGLSIHVVDYMCSAHYGLLWNEIIIILTKTFLCVCRHIVFLCTHKFYSY